MIKILYGPKSQTWAYQFQHFDILELFLGVKIDFVGKNSKSKEKSEEQLRQQYTTNNQVIKSEDQNRGLHVVQIKKVKHNGVEINSK